MKQPHVILGVKEHPTWSEVKKACKQLSLKYHPDRHPGEEEKYHVLMAEVNAAYDYFKKWLPHDEEVGTASKDSSARTTRTVYEDEQLRKWDNYTQEEKQRIWEEMQAQYEFRRKEEYKEMGRKMRDKIARNLEPIRDVNKKFASDIQVCDTFAELKKVATAYTERVEDMIITMYRYTENQHRYGMPPEDAYHTEIFEENVDKDFPLNKVESSQIDGIGYDANSQLLYVRFNGGSVYVYYNVVKYVYDGFMNAESIGSYFGKYIRNKYKYTRLK